jgi:hypothetical protein
VRPHSGVEPGVAYGRGAFSFFAGSTPPTSVGVAASAERLESGYRRGFPRVRDECFEKLMEVTPESGFSQDRRKYIPVCAKIPVGDDSGTK